MAEKPYTLPFSDCPPGINRVWLERRLIRVAQLRSIVTMSSVLLTILLLNILLHFNPNPNGAVVLFLILGFRASFA